MNCPRCGEVCYRNNQDVGNGRIEPVEEDDRKSVFTNCNVCGIKLRHPEEYAMGMCIRCAAE